ncbi:MAG: hypothetical protein WA817_09445 [Candidatus Acidiferrum sp.]
MNLALIVLCGFAALLLVLLIGVLRDPRRPENTHGVISISEERERRHVTYFPQVRQAMAPEDFVFLASRGSSRLARRVRLERRRIALAYLSFLRADFLNLWRLARVVASMSPQVGLQQEFARFRMGLVFSVRYEMVRVKFLLGLSALPELGSLSEVVSRLSIRLEAAMKDLGERAALAAKLASSLDGRDLNTP